MSAYPPPAQQGYGYAPQPQSYPPPAGGQGYPPQQNYKGAPPPYYNAPQQQQQAPVAQQQSTTNVVVVNSQPTPYYTRVIHPVGDHFLTLSVVLTIICCLCGTWYSLLCTIPAIFFATAARDAEVQGDLEGARSKGYFALGCNIAACVWWIVALIIFVAVGVALTAGSVGSCYYDTYYSYYYC